MLPYVMHDTGLHLEGPFINQEKCGAHPPHVLQVPERSLATLEDTYGSLDNVVILTLAPELPGALQVTRQLADKGIVVSLGNITVNLGVIITVRTIVLKLCPG
jgi:N-acetylglucosamine-6-phosphate deacetylase